MPGFHFSEAKPIMILDAAIDRKFQVESARTSHCSFPGRWVLDYSISNCGAARTEFTPWLPRPCGIVHLYPPGRKYEEDIRPGPTYRSAWLIFRGENQALRKLTDNPGGLARIVDQERRILHLLVEIARMASGGNQTYWESCALFCRVLDLLEKLPPPEASGYLYELASSRGLGDRVKGYLEQNYRHPITVKAVAKALGVSESGLAHRYRRESGETLIQSLLRIRVEQSLPLLQSGQPLKNIAPEVGFANEFYYSKIFKRLYGVSPGKYRASSSP